MEPFKICDPKENVTLILSHFWTPINITSARESIHKLFSSGSKKIKNPKIRALSRSGEPLYLEEWLDSEKALYYKNQPILRTCKSILPVPTILLTSSNWSFRGHGKPNLKYLYQRLKGACQICGEQLPFQKMTIEHIEPKSLGGTNEWFNITMTCKSCNSKKGSIFPYKNHKNKTLKAPTVLPYFHTFLQTRPEWEPFLFKNRQ